MSDTQDTTKDVRKTIENLIENGSTYNIDELDRIYHNRLDIMMIDERGEVSRMDKAQNMEVFRLKRDQRAEPLSRWAEFNYVQGSGNQGRVVVTRKMRLRGQPEKFVLVIDLVREDSRWQVIREIVFVQSDESRS